MQGVGVFLQGVSRFNQERLNAKIITSEPTAQPGFEGTVYANHQDIQTQRHVHPPAGLGHVSPVDPEIPKRMGDYGPVKGWNRNLPAGKWNPLWAEEWMVKGRKNIEYNCNFLSAHGNVELTRLHSNFNVQSTTGAAYVIPTQRPVCVNSKFNSENSFL